MTITRIGPTSTPSSIRVPTTNSKPSSPGFSIGRNSVSRSSRRPSSSTPNKYGSAYSTDTDTESASSEDGSGGDEDFEIGSDEQGEEGYFSKRRKKVKRRRFRGTGEDDTMEAGKEMQSNARPSSSAAVLSPSQSSASANADRKRPPTPPIDYLALASSERRRSSFAPASVSSAFDSLSGRRQAGTSILSSQGKVGFVGKGISVADIKSVEPVMAEAKGSSSDSPNTASRHDSISRTSGIASGAFDSTSIRRDPTDLGTQLAIDAGVTGHGDTSARGKQGFAAYSRAHGKSQSISVGQAIPERPQVKAAQSGYFSSLAQQQPLEQQSRTDLDLTPVARLHGLSPPDPLTAPSDGSSTRGTTTVTNSPVVNKSYLGTSPMHIPAFASLTSTSTATTDIPPPCNPRKHRAGVLLSRVRAQTGGNPLAEGDSAYTGLDMPENDPEFVRREQGRGSQVLGLEIPGDKGDEWRSGQEDDEGIDRSTAVDNAARFYYRHPYAKSASTSPVKSFGTLTFTASRSRPSPPVQQSASDEPVEREEDVAGSSTAPGFATVGSLLARRNFTLPFPSGRHAAENVGRDDHCSHATTSGLSVPASSHLIPHINANGRLVILTPTTQEWRELGLDSLKSLGGEGVISESESESKNWDRRSSEASSPGVSSENLEGIGTDSRRASVVASSKAGSGGHSRRSSAASPSITAALNRPGANSNEDIASSRSRVRSDTVHSVDNLAAEDADTETTVSTVEPSSVRELMIQIPPPCAETMSLMGANDSVVPGQSGAWSSGRHSLSLRSAPPLLEETDIFAKLLSEQMTQRQRQSPSPSAGGEPSRHISPVAASTSVNGTGQVDQERPSRHSPSPRPDMLQENLGPAFSLSRSQSMREPPSAPPHMTKREKERERLFRMVGEEIERSGFSDAQGGARGIKQIGKGLGLEMPGSAGGPINPIIRTESGPAALEQSQVAKQDPGVPEPVAQGSDKPQLISPTPQRLMKMPHFEHSPLIAEVRIDASTSPVNQKAAIDAPASSNPRSRAHSRAPSLAQLTISGSGPRLEPPHGGVANLGVPAPLPPLTSRRRQSQRLSLLAGRTPLPHQFPAVLPPSAPTGPNGPRKPSVGLSAFSAFATMTPSSPTTRRPPLSKDTLGAASGSLSAIPGHLQQIGRSDSTLSFAPSTVAPSECGTPVGETAGGLGGGGIDDYVIQSEAGKGAYGLVRRARRKGVDGLPIGDEVIIKYIIKSRILADCWKKHKVLGPIPIEIHVMEQLRNVTYRKPKAPHPWDPLRAGHPDYGSQAAAENVSGTGQNTPTNGQGVSRMSGKTASRDGEAYTAGSASSASGAIKLQDLSEWQAKLSYDNLKDRGHPNIVKMLDFFEDREFYYMVMPRFGIGLDLFDRIESAPDGLEPFDIRSLLGQLSDALAFLHTNGIVHRDIKDENVILDGQGHCQLIDFGSAAHWRPGRKWDTFSGTLDYASPEILRGEMYSGKEQDVWALGVVGFVMICGETPFLSAEEAALGLSDGTKARRDLMARCGGERGEEGAEADGGGRMIDALDFVERCLELEVDNRPPAEALMEHRFVFGKDGWAGFRGWLQTHAT